MSSGWIWYGDDEVFSFLSSTVTSLSVSPYNKDTLISLPHRLIVQSNPNTNAEQVKKPLHMRVYPDTSIAPTKETGKTPVREVYGKYKHKKRRSDGV